MSTNETQSQQRATERVEEWDEEKPREHDATQDEVVAIETSEPGGESLSLIEAWDRGLVQTDDDATVGETSIDAEAELYGANTAPAPAPVSLDQEPDPQNGTERRPARGRGEKTPPASDSARAPDESSTTSREEVAPMVVVEADASPSFEDLGLSKAMLKSIADVGYEEPTPIQLRTIPVLLAGHDAIAQAQTGSGKTAAFGLPIIDSIDARQRNVQALILCPTRELAIQVAEALHKYGRHKEVETLPIYGGQAYERQFRGLQRGVQIVVGTPGRVMDHMRRGTLNLDATRFFVLDEADEMLDMGFIEDIEWILEQVPAERQTALFSATMPPRIAELAKRYMRDPQRISVAGKQMTVPETHQTYYEIPRARKVDALTRILDAETPASAMIFCRTKHGVDELGESLMARGQQVETLHGDLSQAQRDRVMRRFRSGQADVLIATDVAARGLDIPAVSHVINYDIPESAEAYVHRIGRTGRMGRPGEAITLVQPRETRWLHQIERIIKAQIEPRRLPTAADVAERRREVLKEQVLTVLKTEDGYSAYMETVSDLAEEHDALEVAAALLKLYADETGRGTPADQKEDDVATYGGAQTGRGETGMTRLFINVGRNQGIRPQDVVGAIANEAKIPGRSIGAIDILDAYTFVDVPSDTAQRVIDALSAASVKGRSVNVEVAQPGAGGGQPSRKERGGSRFEGSSGPRRDDPRQFRDRSGPPRFRVRSEESGRGPAESGFRRSGPDRGPNRSFQRDDRSRD